MSRAVPDVETGDLYRLDAEKTRRVFLRTLAASGAGIAALRNATARAFGEKPDGKPLVWRYDRFGNPETVRYLPKERYRRIRVYDRLPPSSIYERTDGVNGIRLVQQSDDPTDLALRVLVDNNVRRVRRNVPNRVRKVPVTLEERKVDRTLARVCERRILDFHDPLPASPEVGAVDSDGNKHGEGTLGIVCYNDDATDPYECYITAAHVAEEDGEYAEHLRHGGKDSDGSPRSEVVGSYEDHSPLGDYGMDVIKYQHQHDTVEPDVRGNADDNLGKLSGAWTHSGLTDRTSGSKTLPVKFAGRSTCHATTECYTTSRTASVEYQADYSPNEVAKGDSGGPFLDDDDYLVGTFSTFCEPCEECAGPTATELLDRLNARLSVPEPTES